MFYRVSILYTTIKIEMRTICLRERERRTTVFVLKRKKEAFFREREREEKKEDF